MGGVDEWRWEDDGWFGSELVCELRSADTERSAEAEVMLIMRWSLMESYVNTEAGGPSSPEFLSDNIHSKLKSVLSTTKGPLSFAC